MQQRVSLLFDTFGLEPIMLFLVWIVIGYLLGMIVSLLMMFTIGQYALKCSEYIGLKIIDQPQYPWQEKVIPFLIPFVGIVIVIVIGLAWSKWLFCTLSFVRKRLS